MKLALALFASVLLTGCSGSTPRTTICVQFLSADAGVDAPR